MDLCNTGKVKLEDSKEVCHSASWLVARTVQRPDATLFKVQGTRCTRNVSAKLARTIPDRCNVCDSSMWLLRAFVSMSIIVGFANHVSCLHAVRQQGLLNVHRGYEC